VTGFYRRFWIPNQAILVALGDFREAEMVEKLRRYFSNWPGGKASIASIPAPQPLRGRKVVLIDKPDLTQANILLGNVGVPRDTPRLFPLSLANGVLGRMGFSSRLMDEIRSNLGLAYDVDSHFSMGKVAGPFAIDTSTRNENVGKAIAAILEQLKIFREKGLRPEELAKVKTYKKGIYFIALQESSALVAQMADIEFYHLPRDLIDTYQERIDRVTLEQANAAAYDLFPYQDLLIVILGKAQEIESQLAGLGDMVIEPFRPE
jgi:zinc protease